MKPSNPAEILPGLPQGAEVLVIRLRSLGDMVLLTPALAALHDWRPDLRISVLAEQAFVPVLEGNPAVSEILLRRGFLHTARMLRRRRFPIVFNQHGGPTSALLAAASGSPVRVCWAGRQYAFLYNVLVPPPATFFGERPVHTVEHRMTQLYFTGLPRRPIPPARLYPQADAGASVRGKLARHGLAEGQRYVVIHPGASHASKVWPLDGFAQIARWLMKEHGLRPVVRLGPGDALWAAALASEIGDFGVVFDSRAMDLRETIALIAGARLFVGNDSGPAHLATATGRPGVVIFGATDPVTWRPWQVPHRVLQAAGLCERCVAGRCAVSAGGRCIRSVSTAQVRQACSELLAETA